MRMRYASSSRSQTASRLALIVAMAASMWLANPSVAAEGPIAGAAQSGEFERVQALIADGMDVNEQASDGSTALLWAAYHSHPEMAQALLAAGADANLANNFGVTPLLQASRTGDADMIEVLLNGSADIELTHPQGATPLMLAAFTGRVEPVQLLLDRGANPNHAESYQHQTALMWAVAEGHLDVVDVLLRAGADPNLQARVSSITERKNSDFPSGGFSPLMFAVRNGLEDIVMRLVDAGADLNLTNGDNATASTIAIVNDRFDLAAKLIELGADPDDGSLYRAVEMRDAATDWHALDGSRLRANHDNELTALELMAVLLEAGADPSTLR